MFPVNSVLDKVMSGFRASVEEHCYSVLSSHLKDYEGPAEDFTDRYGEVTEKTISQSVFRLSDTQSFNSVKKALSLFPKSSDNWIIHFGYKINYNSSRDFTDNSSTEVVIIDNYAITYRTIIMNSKCDLPMEFIKVLPLTERLMLPRINNKLIDCIKNALPIYNLTRGYHWQDGYYITISNPIGITENGIAQCTLEQICEQIREIAKYHQRLYGIINGLKKEIASLKAEKTKEPVTCVMDDLLDLGIKPVNKKEERDSRL